MGIRIIAVFLLIASAGCGSSDHHAWTAADSWYLPPPVAMQFTSLGKSQIAPVVVDLQAEAQTALVEVSAKQLTEAEATRLTGQQFAGGGTYVLLRAVALQEGTGAFDVGVNSKAVHVHHGSLGQGPVPMRRKALVAVLPSLPDAVYVTCNMAQ